MLPIRSAAGAALSFLSFFFAACTKSTAPTTPPTPAPPPMECPAGKADCDGKRETACEADLTSDASCGACGAQCREGEACVAGACLDTVPLSTSREHACAIVDGGRVKCWGANDTGQLGSGERAEVSLPALVRGISDAVRVRTFSLDAYRHNVSCAVTRAAKVLCWRDERGALPVEGFGEAVDVAVTQQSICALSPAGEVRCAKGAFVFGAELRALENAPLSDLSHATRLVAAGVLQMCALSRGSAFCWGDEGAPRVAFEQVQDLSPGPCVLLTTGEAFCGKPRPKWGIKSFDDAARVAHGCVLQKSGEVTCWNDRSWSFGLSDVRYLAAEERFACVLRKGGGVACLGHASRGELGNGASEDHAIPVDVDRIHGAKALVLGERTSCALDSAGHVTCWGGQSIDERPPAQIAADIVSLARSGQSLCAIDAKGHATCFSYREAQWQSEDLSAAGEVKLVIPKRGLAISKRGGAFAFDADESGRAKRSPLRGTSDAVDAAGSGDTTCFLHASGRVSCIGWSTDLAAAMKGGVGPDRPTPAVQIAGLTDATRLVGGEGQFCAVRKSGDVTCWTVRPIVESRTAMQIEVIVGVGIDELESGAFHDAVDVAMGNGFSCAALRNGEVACRGYSGDHHVAPPRVPNLTDAIAVAAGDHHACAIRRDGGVSCWGSNAHNQVGTRAPVHIKSPVAAIGVP